MLNQYKIEESEANYINNEPIGFISWLRMHIEYEILNSSLFKGC